MTNTVRQVTKTIL